MRRRAFKAPDYAAVAAFTLNLMLWPEISIFNSVFNGVHSPVDMVMIETDLDIVV